MYKKCGSLFLVACLTLQLVASFPQKDAFEILDNLPEKSPDMGIYQQQRQSRPSDGYDDLRDIAKEERALLKKIIRNVNPQLTQNGANQAVSSDVIVDDVLKFIQLEIRFLASLANIIM